MTPYGPGPINLGPARPNTWYIRTPNGHGDHNPPLELTLEQIATIPIPHAWLTTTTRGLIATWPTETDARDKARSQGLMVGRITPITIRQLLNGPPGGPGRHTDTSIVILTDPNGNPLPGLR